MRRDDVGVTTRVAVDPTCTGGQAVPAREQRHRHPLDLTNGIEQPRPEATSASLVLAGGGEYGIGSLTTREWLNTKQAADYLGLPVGTFRNMASNGLIPYYKLGRLNRYRVIDLRALLLAQKRGGSYVD